jgi:hypothetical protein
MENILLKNFKAHKKELQINFQNNAKNLLLYGDNGAGKSSIYEAIKLIFFREKLENNITKKITPEEYDEKLKEFYGSYNNAVEPILDFTLNINNVNYKEFNNDFYQVFMLNFETTFFEEYLSFDKLLIKAFLDLPPDFLNKAQIIEDNVNTLLKDFLEDISIKIDIEDDYYIKFSDNTRNLFFKKDIKNYFNEAKLNLVILIIIFSTILEFKDSKKKKKLILDDFITSLDMVNRTFIIKYLLEKFTDFQILIFTHNVYFYNLIMYLINDIFKIGNKWEFCNIYEIGNEHRLYMKSTIIRIEDLRNQLNSSSPNFSLIANQSRQKFERLLYEFSKLLIIGAVEETDYILENILINNKIYIDEKGNGCCELVSIIENILNSEVTESRLKNIINDKLSKFKLANLDEIRNVLTTLKLYRKITMHPLSHGQSGQHNSSKKEIKKMLSLLEVLQNNIKDLTDKRLN